MCAQNYADIKMQWTRFALAKDWLEECKPCVGPILLVDVRDTIFQVNPFGPDSPQIRGLHLFQEEHQSRTTHHWMTKWQIGEYKAVTLNEPSLTAGAVAGNRSAILKYLEMMYKEMKEWMNDPKCHFEVSGDDRTITYWLYYSGQLPFASTISFQSGGTVLNLSVEASNIMASHYHKMAKKINITIEKGVSADECDLY